MPWYVLALISAVVDAGYYAFVKKYVRAVDQFVLASGTFLMTAFFAAAFLAWTGWPRLSPGFVPALLGTVGLNFLASTLIYRSLKGTDLSLIVPTKALTPVFLIVTSFFMLGELPTAPGTLGIALIVFGSYVLHSISRGEPLLAYGRRVWREKGIRYMLVVVAIFSVTANMDKMVVRASSPIFALFATSASLGFLFFLVALYRHRDAIWPTYRQRAPAFVLIGLLSAGGGVAINTALSQQIVPYVISLKRFSTVFGVLFGWWFFHEKHILRRAIGAAIMLAGSVCLIVWG